MDESTEKKQKRKSRRGYIISLSLVLLLTAAALLINFHTAGVSIEGNENLGVFEAIAAGAKSIYDALLQCDPVWLAVIGAVMVISYCVDGLALLVFARLYTRHYRFHQGLANTLVGAFYNNVTPGASGGQFMQVYTFKKQGIPISNGASIMVMWFIIYQAALITLDIIALIVMGPNLLSLNGIDILPGDASFLGWNGEITIVPLIIIGFALNVAVILLLFLMSYSHRFHNFILHYCIGFLGKIHLLKNPDKTRENLRIQVENFKIEFRRLLGNIPVTVLIFTLVFVILCLRFSVPYFAGLALNAYGSNNSFDIAMMFDAVFKSAFHQMVTGLLPIPGSAGVSELFFNTIFTGFFQATVTTVDGVTQVIRTQNENMMATQLLWRIATFYLVFIVSGFVAALYRSRGEKETSVYPSRQTFIDLQMLTYEERKSSSDTLYETRQLSKKAIRSQLKGERYLPDGFDTGDEVYLSEAIHRLPEGEKAKAKASTRSSKRGNKA